MHSEYYSRIVIRAVVGVILGVLGIWSFESGKMLPLGLTPESSGASDFYHLGATGVSIMSVYFLLGAVFYKAIDEINWLSEVVISAALVLIVIGSSFG